MYPELSEEHLKEFARAALISPEKKISIRILLSHPTALRLFEKQKQAFIQRCNEKDKHPLFINPVVTQQYFSQKTAQFRAKQPAMMKAISDYINVLNNLNTARVLLTRLSNELTKEIVCAGKLAAFQNASTQYTYQIINTIMYPIPTDNYQKIDKDGLLTQLLLKILQTADMGHRSTKWFGFIPANDANESIRQGHLFVESQFGIGTLHGKYSHMIQWVMLIYAVDMGYIKLPKDITPKSIIQTLVTEKSDDGEAYLWQHVLDRMIPNFYSFADPYRLTSLLATGSLGDDCATLEVYLRDSFCDSLMQWVKAYQHTYPEKISPIAFARLFSLIDINYFSTTNYMIAANHERHQMKLKKETTHHTKNIKFFDGIEIKKSAIIMEKSHRPSSL